MEELDETLDESVRDSVTGRSQAAREARAAKAERAKKRKQQLEDEEEAGAALLDRLSCSSGHVYVTASCVGSSWCPARLEFVEQCRAPGSLLLHARFAFDRLRSAVPLGNAGLESCSAGSSDDDAFYDRTVRDGSAGATAAPEGSGGGKRAKHQQPAAIDAATLSAQREALHAEQKHLQQAIEQESLLTAEVTQPTFNHPQSRVRTPVREPEIGSADQVISSRSHL